MAKIEEDMTFVRPQESNSSQANEKRGNKREKHNGKGLLKNALIVVLALLTIAFAGLSYYYGSQYTANANKVEELRNEIAELKLYKHEFLNEYQDVVIVTGNTCHRPGCEMISTLSTLSGTHPKYMLLEDATAAGYKECSTCLNGTSVKTYLEDKYQ